MVYKNKKSYEQVTPDPINDIPNYYNTFLAKLQEYAEIQTASGTVALTHPVELNGGQTAVMNIKGTLLFAHPQKNLTNDSWKDFFNTLRVAH